MSKLPWFKFFPQDWLTGTSLLHPAIKGAYIDLLSHQWNHGGIPDDETLIIRLTGLYPGICPGISVASVMEYFPVDPVDGLRRNIKLVGIKDELDKSSDKQREKALKRWGKDSEKDTADYAAAYPAGDASSEVQISEVQNQEVESSNAREVTYLSDLVFVTPDEMQKLNADFNCTEHGKSILAQMVKFLNLKIDKKEHDEDVSHYDQLTGWVFEYVMKKPGNSFILSKHKDHLKAIEDSKKAQIAEEEDKDRVKIVPGTFAKIRKELKKEESGAKKCTSACGSYGSCNSTQSDGVCGLVPRITDKAI